MKITKLEHACLDISNGNGRLIIDPGAWTSPLADNSGIDVVVITHVHPDHLDESKLLKIHEQNPSLTIFCNQQVADKLSEDMRVTVPEVGQEYVAGKFRLEFFGGMHAIIMEGYPPAGADHNFGVLIDDTLYYPGDSFTPCPKPHQVVAVPAAGPWMKEAEAVDFLKHDSAEHVFPTHNNILNDNGISLQNMLLGGASESNGKKYTYLKPSETLEV
jgi:L-ascorbate metabolism protein UlaG (beta-lactamase superfamily)